MQRNFYKLILSMSCLGLLVGLASCGGDDKNKKEEKKPDPLAIRFSVKGEWAHDTQSFIQGLVIHNGVLYESTGQTGSWVGIVDPATGVPDKKVVLDNEYFGEGITILNNKLYQLTWEHNIGFIYDLNTFDKLGEFTYDTEGWGITHDSTHLIMSDGTHTLTFLDTTSLKPVRKVKVSDENGAVDKLNELEYVHGYVYANRWESNVIYKIDPADGKVVGRLDLNALARDAKMRNPRADVLNGIAYHHGTGLMLVTGKYWPRIYVLQLAEPQADTPQPAASR